MGIEVTVVAAAEPDVEKSSLPHAPAVAFEVAAEEQLWSVAGYAAAAVFQLELRLFGDDGPDCIAAAAQVTRHWTEMAARTDDHWCRNGAVGHPHVSPSLQRRQSRALNHAGARAVQQKAVELAAPDGEAHDLVVPRLDGRSADDRRAKTRNLLNREAGRPVLSGVEFEQFEHPGRHPAGANFVAGKSCPVENDDVPSCTPEHSGTCRARRPTADDERVALRHQWMSVVSGKNERAGIRSCSSP